MSIQSELDRLKARVNAAHAKVLAKGGTTTAPYSIDNLESAIDSIPVGEEVTEETTAYTDLLAELETVVNAMPD